MITFVELGLQNHIIFHFVKYKVRFYGVRNSLRSLQGIGHKKGWSAYILREALSCLKSAIVQLYFFVLKLHKHLCLGRLLLDVSTVGP